MQSDDRAYVRSHAHSSADSTRHSHTSPRQSVLLLPFPPSVSSFFGLTFPSSPPPLTQASIRSIDPITPRAKPPPFFFTGKPNLYATFDRLTSTLAQVERRLAADGLWPALRGMPKPQRISWKWKSQEEMLEVVNITVYVFCAFFLSFLSAGTDLPAVLRCQPRCSLLRPKEPAHLTRSSLFDPLPVTQHDQDGI